MRSLDQIVITGLGVVSPIGIGTETFWANLLAGKSGVGPITTFDASCLPVRIAAELRDFDPKVYVRPRKSLKVMSREIQIAFAAADLAIQNAQLDVSQVDHARFGVILGSQMIYGELKEFEELYRNCMAHGRFDYDQFGLQFPSHMYPLWMLKYLPNMAACHIAIAQDAQGPNNTIVLGEVSGLLAVAEAAQTICRDAADVMLAGATGSRLDLTGLMYRGDIHLSHRNDDPVAASRPFDAQRDGMVNGEGAAVLVLESRRHAVARGATILASIAGYASAMATRFPDEDNRRLAIRRSIQTALQHAQIEPDAVDHVNAHGLSTVDNDIAEAKAIHDCLDTVPVVAWKSHFGNLGPAGSVVELAGSVLALQSGTLPHTLNYSVPDRQCPVHVVHSQPSRTVRPYALCLNQSGTGQAAAVLIRRG